MNQPITIQGITLTSAAIATIKDFQVGNLDYYFNVIDEMIDMLADENAPDFTDKEKLSKIRSLLYMASDMKNLKTTNEINHD